MTLREKIKFVVLRTIGNFLVLFALYGVVATFGPAMVSEAKFRIGKIRGITYEVAASTEVRGHTFSGAKQRRIILAGPTLGSVLIGPREQIIIPKDTTFSLVIPKIGANAKIFPNVDATNEAEFLPVLKEGIAHAKGTVFPGMMGNIYLFAHSTDNWWNVGQYNAIFYLLKDLSIGDEVIVFFEGRRYSYIVSDKKIVPPNDVAHLVQSQGGPQRLILQTCWPPGTTWERLLVIAVPKSNL